MGEWKEYKWGNLATLEYGKGLSDYLRTDGKYPVYGTNGKIGTADNFLCPFPGIVIGRKGAYRGVHFSSTPFYVIDTAFYLNPKVNDLDMKFAYYHLLTVDINYMDSGSAIPSTSREDFYDLDISLPSLPEQKSIASILSSLDNKIDLLHRQNKTLEALAETLFRQWFVEEAEESWDTEKLGEFGKIICGKTPSKKIYSYFGGSIPFIRIPDMHGKTFIFDTQDTLTEEGANSQQNKHLPPKSICVSCIATVGLVTMNAFNSQTNQQINSIIPSNEIYRYFLYLKLSTMKDELLAMASGGTATDNLNTGDFSNIDIIKPEDNVIELFHNQVQPNFDKIFANQTQIRTLTRLRDTLLPKLMSGEVRVKNAGRLVGKANI